MQLPPGPRAAILLNQALRPQPIETPTALLGRLAVLAAGTSQQRRFEEQIADARSRFSAGISSADPAARIAAIQGGLSSPDPSIVKAAGDLLPLTTPKDKIVATPGGGSSVVPMIGEQVAGEPRVLVQGRAEAPQLLKFNDGEQERTLAFDPQTGSLVDLATAPRATLQRILPPEVFAQQVELRQASGRAQGEATAAGLAAAMDKSAAQASGGQQGRAAATIEMTQPLYQASAQALQAAAAALRNNPTSGEARAAYEAARSAYATHVAQLRTPTEAVTADGINDARNALPDATGVGLRGAVGSDPLTAAMEAIDKSLAGRGGQTTKPGKADGKAPAGVDQALWDIMTPEERAAWD